MKKLNLSYWKKIEENFPDNSQEKISEENFLESRRNFIWKIWAVLFATQTFSPLDLFADPNDTKYLDQKMVFQKIWLDQIFNNFPELNWRWVKLWYTVSNSPNLDWDMWKYKNEDFWWPEFSKKFLEHDNWIISILKAEKNNWKWISWILPKADLTTFHCYNSFEDLKKIYDEWIKLVWSSMIVTIYWKKIKEIEEFFEVKKDFIFIRSWWNKNNKLKSNPENNLSKVENIFTVWASDLSDEIHDFSAKECDFYINTWEFWKNKWVRKMISDSYVSNFQTSEASALLTWVVWILRQILPNSSRKEIEQILQKTARKKYSDWGYLVNAYEAVKLAKNIV